MLLDRFMSWVYTRRLFGPRCEEFESECACCRAWRDHDRLFSKEGYISTKDWRIKTGKD